MARIVVAFSDKQQRHAVRMALEAAGFDVLRACISAAEVLRTFNQCRDGILVCGTYFPDRTVDQLAEDLDGQALILVVGRPNQLTLCENRDVFKLKLPANRAELTTCVDMLVQLHYKRLPKRDSVQDIAVQKAKEWLMEATGMDEPHAHRALQRYSMRQCRRLSEIAEELLKGEITVQDIAE